MTVGAALHDWANSLPLFRFPFEESAIPSNGIYLLFERGEMGHGSNRIVRVGTHTGNNQLRSRLKQHFLVENKDRSIFRKNIGRALLNHDNDPFLSSWDLDRTSRLARTNLVIDLDRQREIELVVSKYIREQFSFAVVRPENKTDRLSFESKIISTLSHCKECGPSARWLGASSPAGAVFGSSTNSIRCHFPPKTWMPSSRLSVATRAPILALVDLV